MFKMKSHDNSLIYKDDHPYFYQKSSKNEGKGLANMPAERTGDALVTESRG